MDWDEATLYIQQNDGSLSTKKSDFAIELCAMVEAKDNTGFLSNVKRAIDGTQKYVCGISLFTSAQLLLLP